MTPAAFAPVRSAISANLFGGKEGTLKATAPDKWKGPAPDLATPKRKQLIPRQVEALMARGLAEGKDEPTYSKIANET